MSTYTTVQKPNLVTAIAVMTLISGIVNIFWGLVATVTVLGTVILAICAPFTVLPTILGVFEIIYAAKLLSNPPQPVRPSTTIAAFEVACILTGNAFSMIVGILSLVFYNDLIVKAFFEDLNRGPGTLAPVQPVPPVVPTPSEGPVEPPAPSEPGGPSEPNIPPNPPGPRKVA